MLQEEVGEVEEEEAGACWLDSSEPHTAETLQDTLVREKVHELRVKVGTSSSVHGAI